MTTTLESGKDLREKTLKGINTLADYVSATLGPKGRNVLIHNTTTGNPFVTKDGVTVAANVNFEDPFVNAAAQIVKQVSALTNSEAGDGTTTSTVLAREIINQSMKHIDSGTSPIELKRGLEKCAQVAIEGVRDMSRPVNSLEDIQHIAFISSNNDSTVADIVSTAIDKIENGSVSIEPGRSHDTTLELLEGFKFRSGYAARAFVTDERRGTCKFDNPMFMICDHKISEVQQILPSLEIAAREGRPFVIVSDDIEGQALASLIMNTVRGSMKVIAIKAPSYGEDRRNIMSDLALATGARFFQQSMGHKLEHVRLTDFGSSRSIEVSKSQTTVVDGSAEYDQVEERIEQIKNEILETENLSEAEKLQDRITRLSSGVAIIRVGANSEVEMTEKKHRIEDALEAVNSAQEQGVVLGGGMTLLKISENMEIEFDNPEQARAQEIFKEALKAPFVAMANNAGLNPEVVMMKIGTPLSDNQGFNFLTGKVENLYNSGVIDPAKVTICAIKNAVSVSSTLLLTDHGIVTSPATT